MSLHIETDHLEQLSLIVTAFDVVDLKFDSQIVATGLSPPLHFRKCSLVGTMLL